MKNEHFHTIKKKKEKKKKTINQNTVRNVFRTLCKIFEEVLLSFNSSLINERKKTKQKIKTK